MRRCSPALAAALLGASAGAPAAADVTPAEVWEGFSGYLSASGYDVDADPEEMADGLRVADVTLRMPVDAGDGSESGELTVTMDEILFEDLGDGTVRVNLPTSVPVVITGTSESGEAETVRIETMSTELDLVVSGVPDEMAYDFEAASLTMRLAALVVEGEPISRDQAAATMRLEAVGGRTTVARTEDRQEITQQMQAETLAYDIAFDDFEGEDEGRVTLAGELSGLRIDGGSVLPAEIDPEDMPAMLDAGFEMSGMLAYDEGRSEFAVDGPDGSGAGQSVSSAGRLSLAISPDVFGYEIGAEDVAYAVTVPDFPIPVTAELQELDLDLSVPISEAEEPQPFSLGMGLRDLTISDTIWALIDPEGALPRDPATIALQLSGTATPRGTLLDPDAMARLEDRGDRPGEINSLEIEDLSVRAVGAELSGEGSFTFDNSDTETFDGVPAPEGSARLTLSGAEALIDTLVNMGVVGEQEAMGARMMLSMFAVPGAGEDTLTSTIEITGDGRVRANGQRIR